MYTPSLYLPLTLASKKCIYPFSSFSMHPALMFCIHFVTDQTGHALFLCICSFILIQFQRQNALAEIKKRSWKNFVTYLKLWTLSLQIVFVLKRNGAESGLLREDLSATPSSSLSAFPLQTVAQFSMQSMTGKAREGRKHLDLVTGASLKEKLRKLPESQV